MKKREAYPIHHNHDFTRFWFTSVGDKGEIKKIVEFTPFQDGQWNLAFGDANEEDFDDEVVSGNNDARKVLQTIANIVHLFSRKYPDRKIYIEPVDKPRKLLYNRVFQVKEEEIRHYFLVEGIFFQPKRTEPYFPGKTYDAFVLSPKGTIFEE